MPKVKQIARDPKEIPTKEENKNKQKSRLQPTFFCAFFYLHKNTYFTYFYKDFNTLILYFIKAV